MKVIRKIYRRLAEVKKLTERVNKITDEMEELLLSLDDKSQARMNKNLEPMFPDLTQMVEDVILSFQIGKIFTSEDVIVGVRSTYPKYANLDRKHIHSRISLLKRRQWSDTIGVKHYFKSVEKEGIEKYTREKYPKQIYRRINLTIVK